MKANSVNVKTVIRTPRLATLKARPRPSRESRVSAFMHRRAAARATIAQGAAAENAGDIGTVKRGSLAAVSSSAAGGRIQCGKSGTIGTKNAETSSERITQRLILSFKAGRHSGQAK